MNVESEQVILPFPRRVHRAQLPAPGRAQAETAAYKKTHAAMCPSKSSLLLEL